MIFEVQKIVYFYAVICAALVVYIIFYVLKESVVDKLNERRTIDWQSRIKQECTPMLAQEGLHDTHKKLLLQKLKSTNQLIAFQKAYKELEEGPYKAYLQTYMGDVLEVFQVLAVKYSGKDPMEKAYFAYVIASCWVPCDKDTHQLTDLLISYLIDGTIYCRENVLQALYRIGNAEAVEKAFSVLNDYGYFHHTKLLADGLMTFTGDKKKLAQVLWTHYEKWNEEIMVAIIQFITSYNDGFKEIFLEVMDDEKTPLEMRLALIRYYKKYPYEPARSVLCNYTTRSDEGHMALSIVAVSALAAYKGPQTKEVLKKALCHKSWYVRYHAAAALIDSDMTQEEINKILHGPDLYASEMLTYLLHEQKVKTKKKMGVAS